MSRAARASILTALAAIITASCTGAEALDGDQPWVTAVDSTGDTIRVHITGAMPEARVSTLVPELEVGTEDEPVEESFGEIATVLGTSDGGLVVHDQQAQAVRLFDAQGKFVRTIGGKGSGPGEYQHLNGITRLPDERIALWDANGTRINLYEADGAFATSWLVTFSRMFATNVLWSDSAGGIYAYAVLERNREDFSRDKKGLIRMAADGRITDSLPYLSWREEAAALKAQSKDGGAQMAYGVPFSAGNHTELLPSGGLVSGFDDEYVFYLLHQDGRKPVRIEREHVKVPVSATEDAEHRARIEFAMRRLDPEWKWSGTGIPSAKPAFRSIEVGRDGRIWVRLSTPAEPIPAAELAPPREGTEPTPRMTTREPIVYDVYSSEGRLLGRVALPPRVTMFGSDGNHVWGMRRDSLDIGYAVRFRIEPAFR